MWREIWTKSRLAVLGLGVAVLVSGILLLALDRQLTFVADDWLFLVKRHGWGVDVLLDPFHGSLVPGLGLAYKLMQEVFGMGSATPYYAVAIAFFLASAVLLFVYLRRRVGDWLALLGAILILFLGAAFEDLLFAFQLGYFVAVAAGLGALIALDREDDRGDRVACALLVVSLAFSSVAIAFLAGAAADWVLGRGPRGRRVYVVLVPVALYVLWWVGWGRAAESHISLDNIAATPEFVFDAASAGIVSLLGLATGDGSEPDQPHLIWGHLLLVAGMFLLVARTAKDRAISRGLAVALAIGIAFWAIAGINRDETRLPTSSRFQYPSAVFLLLIAAEMIRGLRVPRLAIVIAAAITAAAAVGGVSLLQREHDERWVPYANSLRSTLAAVDLAGPSAQPDHPVFFPPDITAPARAYLAAAGEHGSPAFSEAELAARPEPERGGADLTMALALGLSLGEPRPGTEILQCQRLQPGVDGSTGVTLLHGGFMIGNEGRAAINVWLGRFSEGFSVDLGQLQPGATTALSIPGDDAARPWRLGLVGGGDARLCTTG